MLAVPDDCSFTGAVAVAVPQLVARVVRLGHYAKAVPPLDPCLLRLSGGNVAAVIARPLQR